MIDIENSLSDIWMIIY